MNKENKKMLTVLIAAVIISSSIASVVFFGLKTVEKKDELPLSVKIFAEPSEGVVPFKTIFSSVITNYEGEVSYNWDFGNGNESEQRKPKTVYDQNGTYCCNLTVKDERGNSASDSIEIFAIENSPPTLSIEADDRPRRPMNFVMEFVFEKLLNIETYGSQDYRWLRDKGYLDNFFKQESFLTVKAIANDPDSDKIVSYNWTLKPPGYTTRIGKKPMDPKYHYSGKKVDIPTKDIYPAKGYSLICTVTDSSGQKRSEKIEFKVLKSLRKENIEAQVTTINYYMNEWKSQWKENKIIGTLGKAAFALITLNLLSKLPAARLITIIALDFLLQTSPEESTDGKYDSYIGPLKDLTDNRTWAHDFFNKTTLKLQKLSPDAAYSFANFFGAKDMEELREYLDFENKRPVISNPSPQDNAKLVDLNTSKLWISVLDDVEENDRYNVSIYCDYVDTTDHYVNYTNVNNSDNPFNASLITPLPSSTEIEWSVTVEELDNPEEKFTTNYSFTTSYE